MNCYRKIEHVVQKGDTLYELSKYYKTSLPELFAYNPGVNPYNLQVGSIIIVCPGDDFVEKEEGAKELEERFRFVWLQHVYWTRMLLVSIAERLDDEKEVEKRLMQNPEDIANVFVQFYSPEAVSMIVQMLEEHLGIGGALITALRDNEIEEANALNEQWYINAEKMAVFFAQINSYYNEDEMREMLFQHLNILKEEVAARLQRSFQKEILIFSRLEEQAINMADEFTEGIIKQFAHLDIR